MKKTWIRAFALTLCLILSVSLFPMQAHASDAVSGQYADEPIWRNHRSTYPFEFDATLNRCTGLTVDYEIMEVSKGNMSSGKFKMEVYGRNPKGDWRLLGDFYLKDLQASAALTFEPMSIDAVAVVCQKQGSYEYAAAMTIRDAIYKGSTEKAPQETQEVLSDRHTELIVSGEFSDSKFTRNGRSTYPFEFDEPLKRCTGFTLNYEIVEISSGNLDGNFKFAVYVHTTSGKWKYAKEFKMDDMSVSKEIRFDAPVSIDAVAVVCLKNANYSYSYTFTITEPTTKK